MNKHTDFRIFIQINPFGVSLRNKIEDRTNWFLEEYGRLKAAKKLPKDKELVSIMGMKSVSTLSEIKGKRQNIQPEQWDKFRKHFDISEKSEHKKTQTDSSELGELLRMINGLSDENRELRKELNSLKQLMEIQVGHHNGLREYVLSMAHQLLGGDYKTQQIAVGKAESAALEKRFGKGKIPVESAGMIDSPQKKAKAH